MTPPREKELKMSLPDRRAHDKLLRASGLGPLVREEQENHYFDTADFALVRSGSVLRLRRTEKRLILTFKAGAESPETPGYFDALEIEEEVPEAVLSAALQAPSSLLESDAAPIREARRRFGRLRLAHVGCLHTERHGTTAAPFPLEIDRIRFPDGTEAHEVEIETETPAAARRWLLDLLESAGVEAVPQRHTKLEVFLAKLGVKL